MGDGNRFTSNSHSEVQGILKIHRSQSVMHKVVGSQVIRIRSTGNENDGKFFGVSSGQSIDAVSGPRLKVTTQAAAPFARA